jgi:7-cyano-7-deazaguanine synthase
MKRDESALVLFSGGQDSTTCLAWALERYQHVQTVGFDYGQRHRIEIDCRAGILKEFAERFPKWAARLGPDHVLPLGILKEIGDSALFGTNEIVDGKKGLPTSFVPGRNILFLTVAAALAYKLDLKVIVGGMCETDFSGYPDCRDDTVKAVQVALNLGMDERFTIETPLMWLDKAATWQLAVQLGGYNLEEIILELTHTCYAGVRSERQSWGYGCGDCPACKLRAAGYGKYSATRKSESVS